MKKISVVLSLLCLAGVLCCLIGWSFLDWPTTSSLPYFIVSLVLGLQSSTLIALRKGRFRLINSLLLVVQLIFCAAYFFSILPISSCWLPMIVMVLGAIHVTLLAKTMQSSSNQIIRFITLFQFVIACVTLVITSWGTQQFGLNYLWLITSSILAIGVVFIGKTKQLISK